MTRRTALPWPDESYEGRRVTCNLDGKPHCETGAVAAVQQLKRTIQQQECRENALQGGGRFVAPTPRSLRSGRPALRVSLSEPGTVARKNRPGRYPSGRLPPG